MRSRGSQNGALSDGAALALARELKTDASRDPALVATFLAFLRREGLSLEDRRIALGTDDEPRRGMDRIRQHFGFWLSGLAAASLVLSIANPVSDPDDFEVRSFDGLRSLPIVAYELPASSAETPFVDEAPQI
ncbi:MAG: hypothetical protein KDB53_10035 [Planctomycetes bacterium]|nr:hypothetical protein [Planctomycetota bacterium]